MFSTTAEATVNALRSVFATHGLPEELVTDNGVQFIAQELKDFLRSNKIKHILSALYHPVLPKEYPYSPPQAKDYPKSPPQAKLEQIQTQETGPEATSAKDSPEARKLAVKSPVQPLQRYPRRVRKPPKSLIEEA